MPRGVAAKAGSKTQRKQPQAQNPDPVAPAHTSQTTAAQVQPLLALVPVACIFPTHEQLQAPLNLRSQSPGERFDDVASGSDSDLGNQPTTPTRAVNRSQIPVLVSPIKARQKRAAENIKKMSDDDVWDMTDQEIIGMFIIINYCTIFNECDLLKRCCLRKSFFTSL